MLKVYEQTNFESAPLFMISHWFHDFLSVWMDMDQNGMSVDHI